MKHLPAKIFLLSGLLLMFPHGRARGGDAAAEFNDSIRPLLQAHCLDCHSAKLKKGNLDLERFATVSGVQQDLRTWQQVLEMLESGEMPPKEGKSKPLLPAGRQRFVTWTRDLIHAAMLARSGDPGPAMIRRLSNAEYDRTIHDLTGVDLRPAKHFPADGAGGEGFLNASEVLEISPELLAKYFTAAKQVASHAVLLPDGFRFSPSESREDWSNEVLGQLRAFHAEWTDERGGLPLEHYLAALLRQRKALATGEAKFAAVAAQERLSAKYLESLWGLWQDDKAANVFLAPIRSAWKLAQPEDAPALALRIQTWQGALWKTFLGGTAAAGGQHLGVRQVGVMPSFAAESQVFELKSSSFKPPEVVFYLAARAFSKSDQTFLRWERPRFEAPGQPPLSLRDALLLAEESRKGQAAKPVMAGTTPLALERFGRHPAEGEVDDISFVSKGSEVLEVRLPAALIGTDDMKLGGALNGRTFVVEVRMDAASSPAAVAQVQVKPGVVRDVAVTAATVMEGGPVFFRGAKGIAAATLQRDADEFRRWFPALVCFQKIIPTDGAVTLERFHREDEPLVRLLLDDAQRLRLDRLWRELHYTSRDSILVLESLATLTKGEIGEYEQMRKGLEADAAALRQELLGSEPGHLASVLDFAARAFRRPLAEAEQEELRKLYRTLRGQNLAHDEAWRGVLARVLVSPAFLYRLEQPGPGKLPRPVSDWELATRLSYFLWATMPDDELRRAAAAGKLRDPQQLAEQTRRMLLDPRVRGMAVEFGTQWLEVRAFDEFAGRDEKLFPAFDASLRAAIYEETILLFADLFQADRPVGQLLDSDATFVNERLAAHYGIPGVAGPEWRRVEGVRKFGRGGVLGLASVLTKQSGAARTSPVLRGNWVGEILLGDRLPRPPANIPKLPETEDPSGLTVRQMVEKHVQAEQCAICHRRIDPLGFALENFDPIGRWRDQDAGGRPIDAKAKFKSGAEFTGVTGLRAHLLGQRKKDFQRQFCKKLLGYALGRGVSFGDQPLLDDMAAALNRSEGRVSAAILAVVASPQFRSRRGADADAND